MWAWIGAGAALVATGADCAASDEAGRSPAQLVPPDAPPALRALLAVEGAVAAEEEEREEEGDGGALAAWVRRENAALGGRFFAIVRARRGAGAPGR